MILSFSYSSTSNAALSATTAKTIKGTEPTFKAVSGENRLGFTVGSKFYSESSTDTGTTGNIVSGTSKTFDKDLTFNDFAVKTLTFADFTVANDYDDSDGDVAHSTTPFTTGGTTYKWRDNSGASITGDDLSKMIGCSGYSMPLKLEITLSGVQVHSEYGDPRDSVLTDLTKTYQIDATSGICFAKADLTVFPAQVDPLNGGGYSADFDPAKGFKASANPAFPTTGFPNAKFQLVMTGLQTDWTYAVPTNPGNGVTVDSNGNVTLTSKPTGTGEVIVSATSKNLTPQVTHTYKFNPTTNGWFVPKSGAYNYASAKLACPGGEPNIPTRKELTNSPRNSAALGTSLPFNYYTRAIGGGVFGEWGNTNSTTYPSSQWVYSGYWTRDVYASGSQFAVWSNGGGVDAYSVGYNFYVACRG